MSESKKKPESKVVSRKRANALSSDSDFKKWLKHNQCNEYMKKYYIAKYHKNGFGMPKKEEEEEADNYCKDTHDNMDYICSGPYDHGTWDEVGQCYLPPPKQETKWEMPPVSSVDYRGGSIKKSKKRRKSRKTKHRRRTRRRRNSRGRTRRRRRRTRRRRRR